MDVLVLLREFSKENRLSQVQIQDDEVLFGDSYTFPRTKKTAYKSNMGKGDFYTLDTLVFFLQHSEDGHQLYMSKAKAADINTVAFLDRKDLTAYLTGQTDHSEYVALIGEGPLDDETAEPSAKRQRGGGAVAAASDNIRARVAAQERQLRDRNSILLVPGKTFEGVINVVKEVATMAKEGSGKASGKPSAAGLAKPGSKSAPTSTANGSAAAHKGDVPHYTILLAPGTVGLINMHNAEKFFEDGLFRSWEECHKAGVQRTSTVTITRKGVGGKPDTKFTLTDRPPRHDDEKAWKRVVAVVVNGKLWQFKDFAAKGAATGDLAETFHNMLGIYFHYHDESVPQQIKQWNVKALSIHRNDRHKDAVVQTAFYRYLDQFLSAKFKR